MDELNSDKPAHTRFDRPARLTLAFAILLIVLDVIQVAYRYRLPTDGWSVTSEDILGESNWVYVENLVGGPSPLREDDVLLAVEGLSVVGTATNASLPAPANWRAGGQVTMSVLREGEEITLSVPVVRWTPAVWMRRNLANPANAVTLLGTLVLAMVGFFTFFKRPELPSARALLILSAAVFCTAISATVEDGLSAQFDPFAFAVVLFYSYAIFGVLLAPTLLAFTLHFPHSKPFILRYPVLRWLPVWLGVIVAFSVLVLDLAVVGWLGTMLMVIGSLVSLVHARFTQRDAISRAQMRWAVGGFVVGLGLALLTFLPAFGLVEDPFWAELLGAGFDLGFPVVGVALAIAVLRYRLFDIDLIIRRTLIYSTVTGLLGLTYFGVVAVLQAAAGRVANENSPLAVVVSTLVIAALFTPLRQRVQQVIDRRFYRQKYDAQRTLEAFSETMRDEVNLDRLTGKLIEVVDSVMQPQRIGLWISPTGEHKSDELDG